MNRLFALLACAAMAHAQEIMSVTGDLSNGLIVHCSARVEPALKDSQILLLGGGVMDDHDRIHRSVIDKVSNTIIGYDLFAEPAGAPDLFLVRIEPLTKTMTQGRIAMLPKYPPPQTVREGDVIALDLLVSPDGKQKLVDYIAVSRRGVAPRIPIGPARDFTLDDGPLALSFTPPTQVYVNGRLAQDRLAFTVKPGGTLWFGIPGHGRYILSLAPRDNFEKAGVIRDHTLRFQAGPDSYEVRTGGPILGAGRAWNLYGHHDPGYKPHVRVSSMIHGGIDRLENLLRGDDPLQELNRRLQDIRK